MKFSIILNPECSSELPYCKTRLKNPLENKSKLLVHPSFLLILNDSQKGNEGCKSERMAVQWFQHGTKLREDRKSFLDIHRTFVHHTKVQGT